MPAPDRNPPGKRFGRLVVLARVGSWRSALASRRRVVMRLYLCQCDCGNFCQANSQQLRRCKRSCGCLWRESLLANGRANKGKRYRTKAAQHVLPVPAFSATALTQAWGGR